MIRKALATDAAAVAPLILDAIGFEIAHDLTGASNMEEAIRQIGYFFAQKDNRLSYENAVVATNQQHVIGIALFYHGSQTERLDRPFIERWMERKGQAPTIVKEAQDDEFYLDSVAVHPDCRGKGVGATLLKAFEKEAEARGYERIALLVDEDNGKARKLYESFGYRPDATKLVSEHLYYHMVKTVPVLV